MKTHTIAVNNVIKFFEINRANTSEIGNNKEITNNIPTDINVVVDVSEMVFNPVIIPAKGNGSLGLLM